MKILHIVSSYWPAFEFGGPIQSVHLLNKNLASLGLDVTVYTTNAGLEDKKEILGKENILEGVKVNYFPYFGPRNYNFSPALFFALKENIKNFDLVHITGVWNFPVFAGAYWARKFKKPYILSPRGSLYPETFRGISFLKYLKKRIYWLLISKRDVEKASLIHYTTLDEAERTRKFLNLENKFAVIPNGLDREEFLGDLPAEGEFKKKYLPSPKSDYLLILGRLNWKKGFDILIPAVAEILKDFPDLYLVVVGPDERGYKKEIEGWIKKYGLEKKIIFTGLLVGRDKWGAYRDAEAFLLPSYSENFGMVVVEAMAMGTPVIISDKVGIYKEIKENEAGVVARTNKESLYQGMRKVLADRNFAQKIARNGKKLVEKNYDIKEVARKMEEMYANIIELGTRL